MGGQATLNLHGNADFVFPPMAYVTETERPVARERCCNKHFHVSHTPHPRITRANVKKHLTFLVVRWHQRPNIKTHFKMGHYSGNPPQFNARVQRAHTVTRVKRQHRPQGRLAQRGGARRPLGRPLGGAAEPVRPPALRVTGPRRGGPASALLVQLLAVRVCSLLDQPVQHFHGGGGGRVVFLCVSFCLL